MLAAIVNVVLNFLLIKPLGVYGVIVTLMVTYLVLVIYRWHDMKRYFTLKFDKRTCVPVCVMLLYVLPFYFVHSLWLDIVLVITALAIIIWACGKDLRDLLLAKFAKSRITTK